MCFVFIVCLFVYCLLFVVIIVILNIIIQAIADIIDSQADEIDWIDVTPGRSMARSVSPNSHSPSRRSPQGHNYNHTMNPNRGNNRGYQQQAPTDRRLVCVLHFTFFTFCTFV